MESDFTKAKPATDLLGDPVDQRAETWGRPSHKKTPQNQEVVRVLKAAGWPHKRIARHLGVCVDTLAKHYSDDLEAAVDAQEAAALMTIHRRMKEGNVTAANRIMVMAEKGRAAPPVKSTKPEPEAAEAPEAKLGKKERQAAAAQIPTDEWANLIKH